MTYKNKGPPKRSEGVLQTGIRRYDIFLFRHLSVAEHSVAFSFYASTELQEIGFLLLFSVVP